MKKTLRIINRAEELVVCFVLLEMAILTFVQVVMRYLFGTSLTWAEEILRYQLCFVAFMGADIGLHYGAHLKAEIINLLVKGSRGRAILNAFVFLMIFIFCFVFGYYGFSMVLKVAATGQLTAATRIPKFYIYLPIPLGALFMCFRSAAYFVRELRQFVSSLKSQAVAPET